MTVGAASWLFTRPPHTGIIQKAMLELTIEQTLLSRSFPIPQGRPVGEWRDSDGEVCAYGWVCEDGRRIDFPGLATYTYTLNGSVVTATPTQGADLGAIRETFFHSVLPLVLQSMGCEALHASAVIGSRGVLAICAVSGTGKSTLAYALGRAGFPVWADDAVVIRQGEGTPRVASLPFTLRLRAASRAYFGESANSFSAEWYQESGGSKDLPLAAVCVLQREESSDSICPVRLQRLSAAEAFPALLEHAYCFDLDDNQRKVGMIDHYLTLADTVPVYSVRFTPGFEHLPELVEMVAQASLRAEEGAA